MVTAGAHNLRRRDWQCIDRGYKLTFGGVDYQTVAQSVEMIRAAPRGQPENKKRVMGLVRNKGGDVAQTLRLVLKSWLERKQNKRHLPASYSQAIMDGADEIDRLRAENERLTQWINDLQSGTLINCVYCGHQYGPKDSASVSMADALKEHVEQCPEHPMSKIIAQNTRYLEALEHIAINVDDPANWGPVYKGIACPALKC